MTPGLSHRFEALKVMADGVALDPRDDAVTVVNYVMSAGVSASPGRPSVSRVRTQATGGAIISGDAAVAVLQFTATVPNRFGTAQGPPITSAAYAGEAADTVLFV